MDPFESHVNLDNIDNSSRWRTAEGVEDIAASLESFMERYEKDQEEQRKRDIVDRRRFIANFLVALIAAIAAVAGILLNSN